MAWDGLWLNVDVATMMPGGAPYGALTDGAIGVAGGRIAWVGARGDLPGPAERLAAAVHDGGGRWLTPGLIDCHTHLVYGGNWAAEFEMRLEGATYEDIARAGGGIVATVRETRAATQADLVASAGARLADLRAEGVTTIEIKSGYVLDRDTELKQLRVARRLADTHAVTVRTTFLGAHALPPEFAGRADAYIAFVCDEALPAAAAAGAADAVDAFCETIGFSAAQTARVFDQAGALGLLVKLHASSCRTPAAPSWRLGTARCQPTTWSMSVPMASRRWPRPAPSPCCCPAPSTSCARPRCRRSNCCEPTACRSRSPRMRTPARRR